jgi:site-specific DNA recombinase
VVVYKIDRLTRSLTDFSKMVEVFERHKRLLRVGHPAVQHHHLDGAADAERPAVLRAVRARGHRRAHPRQDRRQQAQGDVDGRGAALGYDVENRLLVINEAEAAVVRRIFEEMLTIGSPTQIAANLNLEGVTTKAWTTQEAVRPLGRADVPDLLAQERAQVPLLRVQVGKRGSARRARATSACPRRRSRGRWWPRSERC